MRFPALAVLSLCFGIALAPDIVRATEPQSDTRERILAGPHLDGDAYRALRPQATFEVIKFSVLSNDANDEREIDVVLGPDFVIEGRDSHTTIYDFRFRRLIEIESKSAGFSNDSMFGSWHMRWAFLQNNLWAGAMLAAGGLVDDPALARFWIEQHNGLNHPAETANGVFPRPRVRVDANASGSTIMVGRTTVAEVRSGSAKFPDAAYASTFAAWLTWSLRFHPDVAAALADSETLPESIERTTKASIPEKTQSETLRFVNARRSTEAFSVLAGLDAKIPSWEPLFPHEMAALMIAAARGLAPNGPVSDEEYAAQIEDLVSRKRYFDATLLAIHATHGQDGCGAGSTDSQLCDVALSALRISFSEKKSSALFQALQLDGAGNYGDAALAMIALRSDDIARPDILDIMIANSIVEAKNGKQLNDQLNVEFTRLPELFLHAFGRDPYDPSRYRDYYNYLHAATRSVDEGYLVLLRAYPVIDVARSLPERGVPAIVSAITEVERNISRDFPVLFPTFAEGE